MKQKKGAARMRAVEAPSLLKFEKKKSGEVRVRLWAAKNWLLQAFYSKLKRMLLIRLPEWCVREPC